MAEPSWRQFALISFDATVAQVIRALGIDPPPEGLPRTFNSGGFWAHHSSDGDWLIYASGLSQPVAGPREVLAAAHLPIGTPSGDALRQWLSWWGWVPAKKRQPEPHEHTQMVT